MEKETVSEAGFYAYLCTKYGAENVAWDINNKCLLLKVGGKWKTL